MEQETRDVEMASADVNLEPDYRSIQGKAKRNAHPADPDLDYVTDTSASDYEGVNLDSWNLSARERNIELSEAVDQGRSNIKAWLDLINHQDVLLDLRKSGRRHHPTEAESRSTADVKLSMYEKALNSVGKEQIDYEELLLGLLETGSKIWEYVVLRSLAMSSTDWCAASKLKSENGKPYSRTTLVQSGYGLDTSTFSKLCLPHVPWIPYARCIMNASTLSRER